MKQRMGILLMAGLVTASCGGSSGGGSGSVPVVAGPGTTPTASPSPTASPTAALPTYLTYAQLTGDQSFKTNCATLRFDTSPPLALPVLPFGTGLTLNYAAATGTYTVAADAFASSYFGPSSRSYGPADRDPAAPANVISFARTGTGFQERLTIGANTTAGATPDYVRGFSLRTPLYGSVLASAPALQWSCIFGVPTRIDDEPRGGGVVTFTRTGLNAVAYAYPVGAAPEAYALGASTVSFSVDLSTYRVTTTVHLVGNLQTANGPVAATTDLGTYSGAVTIDENGFYNGLLTSADRSVRVATFGGWFFGPQGAEAAYSIGITSLDPANGRQISVIGNAIALR